MNNLMDIFSIFVNINVSKQKNIGFILEILNKPEFAQARQSIERSIIAIQNILNNQSYDINRKILDTETVYLKELLDKFVKDGVVSQEEIHSMNFEIDSLSAVKELKTLLNKS